MIPLEIQDYIFEFIQPYLTRQDWRTCRLEESDSIQQLVRLLQCGKPRNHCWGVRYKDWTFYEKMRFSTLESCKSLSSWYIRPKNKIVESVYSKKNEIK